MKIILLDDIRGKGKKDEVIEVASGYAVHLIREHKAIDANKVTMTKLKNKQIAQENEDLRLEKEALANKIILEKKPLSFTLNVGKDGKVFKSVSHKQIVDRIFKDYSIKVEKKKFKSKDSINSLGSTKVAIELFKGVIATIDVVIKAA